MDFSTIRGVVLDMDGVLWRGDEALPGLIPFFDTIRRRGIPFFLATNNSGKSPESYVQKLAKMGVEHVDTNQIITSGTATASYLGEHYEPGARVHVLGGDGLREIMARAGFIVVDDNADVVVVGLDPQVTYEKLKRATLLIRAGAVFVATNNDLTIPTPEGLAPGAGSLIAALQAATGQAPSVIVGKPHAPMFEAAVRLLGIVPEATLMIGDRLNTDIEGAAQVGLQTALVLTGVSTRSDVVSVRIKPDAIFDNLETLLAAWVTERNS